MAKTKRRTAQTPRRPAQTTSGSQQRRPVQETPTAEVSQSDKLISSKEATTAQSQQERLERSQRTESSRAAARAQTRNTRQRYQQKRRSPWLVVGIAVVVIGVIIGIFAYLSNQNGGSTNATGQKPTDPVVLKEISNVDPAILEAVNTGGIKNPITATQGKPPKLTGPTGKPEFFYDGAEYCPYCAAERWAVSVALSRFGQFTKLPETSSSSVAGEVYPNTATLSFHGSSYSSSYIDFVSIEETTNQPDGKGGYVVLQTPTADEAKIINKYNAAPYTTSPGIPFISIANQYLEPGPAYVPDTWAGLSQQDIAGQLSNSSSAIAKNILGGANYLTAAICAVTSNQPGSVCTTGVIPSIEQSLPKLQGSTQVPGSQTAIAMEPRALIGKREN